MSEPKSFHLTREVHDYLIAHGTPPDPVLRELAEETARLGSLSADQRQRLKPCRDGGCVHNAKRQTLNAKRYTA